MRLLRSLIRETLLLEEVYGAQATVYHGTEADPQKLITALLNDEFKPGTGSGSMYGKGLYTVYDLKGTQTEKGEYGDHVIKLKVNLYGYIIFDPDVALKVYKRPLTPAEQAKEVGYSETVVDVLSGVKQPQGGKFTSDLALNVYKKLQPEVKGLVFTGKNDGRVVVVYDPTTAVPMAWKRTTHNKKPVTEPWTPVDRETLLAPSDRPDVSAREGRPVQQSALRRSATGDFEAGKWGPLTALKQLEQMPEDKRIVMGGLNLSGEPITSLPKGLHVNGALNLVDTPITALPAGLRVDGYLDLGNTPITSLPADLDVRGGLYLSGTPITELPAGLKVGGLHLLRTRITSLPSGLQVGEDLNLTRTSITSLPADLKVGGNLTLSNTPITSLPTGLKVGGNLNLINASITSLPTGLKVGGNLDIRYTPVTSLPADLDVRGGIYLSKTPITELPAGLKVGSVIYGLDRKYWSNVPEHLKDKLR